MRRRFEQKHMILENSEFKIVCDGCGSLAIKPIDSAHAASETKIQCGGCNAVRGTLADLRALAHLGKDLFEF
jgi:ribosomal protein S27E